MNYFVASGFYEPFSTAVDLPGLEQQELSCAELLCAGTVIPRTHYAPPLKCHFYLKQLPNCGGEYGNFHPNAVSSLGRGESVQSSPCSFFLHEETTSKRTKKNPLH
ncbi:hypothetical protein AVEN_80786-1 [Araneus ventricosus]|uniref:Uncharacterized protein n=1 Tax=Araneus ventricosus TaxID=182803 RepID=A0A4Y2T8E9_ARAVE|nr:hypothetical protein AVEN_80786-1 [Araneus ventricosus]